MLIRNASGFPPGYTSITELGGRDAGTLMSFGILRLLAGEEHRGSADRERAYLLLSGAVDLEWKGHRARVTRRSLLDDSPWCLHLSRGCNAALRAVDGEAEIACHATDNPRSFPARLFAPADCRSEERGKGTMGETSTRIVRSIIEDPDSSSSSLVLGEVITFPGKWSSYPPHHHPQPEIYHYRFLPQQGFGLAVTGDEAHIVRHGDTVVIAPGAVHPQAAAPGYAMYYIWVIRHLEGNRYRTPTFQAEHLWVTDPASAIWPHTEERA